MAYRLRDILVAAIGLLLFLGPALLIILLLALTQQRIFFTQSRTGHHGRPFRLIKFSTLRDIRPGEREEDNQQARLTPIGKFLRRLSFDEIPQLINVLLGHMSLVGPRPLIHAYWPLYSPEQRRRFRVRPGITGWAQINGRNRISFTRRFQLDNWYIDHRSFALDLKIIALTFRRAFQAQDLYSDQDTTSPRFDGHN